MSVRVSLLLHIISSVAVARYLIAPFFLSWSSLTLCRVYNASTSEKYQPSSSAFPSNVGAARSPLCGKSAKAILAGGAGTGTGGIGCIGGNGGKVRNCVAGGATGVA